MKPADRQRHLEDITSFLKERLEYHYARGDTDDAKLCATMVAAPAWPKGTGIRPRILAAHRDGGNIYEIKCGQARKFLETLGHTPPPKELS